jgi:DNA (cytosine-5)-methyltransferase 1
LRETQAQRFFGTNACRKSRSLQVQIFPSRRPKADKRGLEQLRKRPLHSVFLRLLPRQKAASLLPNMFNVLARKKWLAPDGRRGKHFRGHKRLEGAAEMSLKTLTLGSLFDGSGAFPYAALKCGITPVWASEIEPFCVRVTTKRLPQTLHLGDISKIDGGKIPRVDIISFGSPCQDMSVASGKRKGIGGKRSILFYEAIRIIKEMRGATRGKYPKYAVWENVVGAFSSGNREDFRQILQAFARIKGKSVSVPRPPKGKWLTAGEILADNYSIAYRTVDAQYFGVPQRRRRIYLVVDFGGLRASEILFNEARLFGDTSTGEGSWQGIARNSADCAHKAVSGLNSPCAQSGIDCLAPWEVQSRRVFSEKGVSPALSGSDGGGGRNPTGLVLKSINPAESERISYLSAWDCQRCRVFDEYGISPTVDAGSGGEESDFLTRHQAQKNAERGHCSLFLDSVGEGSSETISVGAFIAGQSANARSIGYSEKTAPTLKGESGGNAIPCVALPWFNFPCEACPALNAAARFNGYKSVTGSIQYAVEHSPTIEANMPPNVVYPDVARSLTARHDSSPCADRGLNVVVCPIDLRNAIRGADSGHNGVGVGYPGNPQFTMSASRGNVPAVAIENSFSYDARGNGDGKLAVVVGDHNGRISDHTSICVERKPCPVSIQGNIIGRKDENRAEGKGVNEDVSFTLNGTDIHAVAYSLDRSCYNQGKNALYDPQITEGHTFSVVARGAGAICAFPDYIVRRLTPTECASLQGMPKT